MGKMEDMFHVQKSEMLLKKAKEMSELCDSDIGVLLFSPKGGISEFASGEGLEDVYLKLLENSPDIKGQIKNSEELMEGLMKLKKERQLLKKVTNIQDLWEEAINVNHSHRAMTKRLSLYNPNIKDFKSLEQIHESEHLIAQAIKNIHEMKSKKLSEIWVKLEQGESSVMTTGGTSQEQISSPEMKRRIVVKDEHTENLKPGRTSNVQAKEHR